MKFEKRADGGETTPAAPEPQETGKKPGIENSYNNSQSRCQRGGLDRKCFQICRNGIMAFGQQHF